MSRCCHLVARRLDSNKRLSLLTGSRSAGWPVSPGKSPFQTQNRLRLDGPYIEGGRRMEIAMGDECKFSSRWNDVLSAVLDETAQPAVNQDTNSLGALLAENARLRKLAIQLSNMLG